MTSLLGSGVTFSFATFFAIHPMPATMPVGVAASRIVFTSLLSDMIYLKTIFLIGKPHTNEHHQSSDSRRHRKVFGNFDRRLYKQVHKCLFLVKLKLLKASIVKLYQIMNIPPTAAAFKAD